MSIIWFFSKEKCNSPYLYMGVTFWKFRNYLNANFDKQASNSAEQNNHTNIILPPPPPPAHVRPLRV